MKRAAAGALALLLMAGDAALAAQPAAARFPTPSELARAVNLRQSEAVMDRFGGPQASGQATVVLADGPIPRATHVRCAVSRRDPGEVDCRFTAVWSLPGAGSDRYVATLKRSEDGWRIVTATTTHRPW